VAKDTLETTFEVGCPIERVFKDFQNVQLVSTFLPILSELNELEYLKSYTAVLEDKVGPFKLRADLAITTAIDEELMKFAVEARGEDRQVRSAIRISAEVQFEKLSDNATNVRLTGTYEVSGKVATLGASVIKGKAHKLMLGFESQVKDNFCG
jgi:carbon monoxide dehydrogenase subunit G